MREGRSDRREAEFLLRPDASRLTLIASSHVVSTSSSSSRVAKFREDFKRIRERFAELKKMQKLQVRPEKHISQRRQSRHTCHATVLISTSALSSYSVGRVDGPLDTP